MQRSFFTLLGLCVIAACSDTLPVETPASAPRLSVSASDDASSRYVVLLKNDATAFGAAVAAHGGTIETVHPATGIAIVSGLSETGAAAIAGTVDALVDDFSYQGVSYPTAPDAEELVGGTTDVGVQSQTNPATAFFYARQWHHRAIGANVAWAAGRLGSPNVEVAILDSGIDHLYPDLVSLVETNPARARSFVPTNGTNPVLPTDDQLLNQFFPGSGRPIWSDLNGHGSHVAATVSSLAIVNAGVTSRVRLIPVKVLNARGTGSFSGILSGILHATDVGAEVINMSLGAIFARRGNHSFTKFLDVVTRYARNNGVTIVVAAGNDALRLHPSNNGLYGAFCSTQNVICVSATGPVRAVNAAGQTHVNGPNFLPSPDLWSIFTNYGIQHIDVAAPGGNYALNSLGRVTSVVFVFSACSKTRLDFIQPAAPPGSPPGTPPPPPFYRRSVCAANPQLTFTLGSVGTSMASPHVAGLAALLVEQYGRNPGAIKAAIQNSADDIVEFGKPGRDDYYGHGRINVARALGLM